MNQLQEISPNQSKNLNEIDAIIEIPLNSKNKYELDKSGLMRLSRVLHTSFRYPFNYGFIPQTFCADNDALDVVVISKEDFYPNTIVRIRPIGVLRVNDQGEVDDKILGVPIYEPEQNELKDLRDVPKHVLLEIKHFFTHYKDLEGKKVKVLGWNNSKFAKKIINSSLNLYKKRFKKQEK